MEELNDADMSSPGWLTRFKTLKHDYEHHMEEEEELGLIEKKEADSLED